MKRAAFLRRMAFAAGALMVGFRPEFRTGFQVTNPHFAVGLREQLADVIYSISPVETPFSTLLESGAFHGPSIRVTLNELWGIASDG